MGHADGYITTPPSTSMTKVVTAMRVLMTHPPLRSSLAYRTRPR